MGKRKKSYQSSRSQGQRRSGPQAGHGRIWLFGRHAVLAALGNADRECHRFLLADTADDATLAEVAEASNKAENRPQPERCSRADLDAMLPPGTVHQGMALLVSPLPDPGLEVAWEGLGADDPAIVVVLDQATDPRNIGAVLRSAAAFGARAVIVQDRHAPDATGAMAKAASGGLERVPLVQVVNLSRCLEELKREGFWCAGLDGGAEVGLAQAGLKGRIAIVLGAEGSGLRRLTRLSCDMTVKIPMTDVLDSLNLSNAAAIALYELTRTSLPTSPG